MSNNTNTVVWLIWAFPMSRTGCSSIKISVVRFVLRIMMITLKGICFHFGALLIDLDVHFPLFCLCLHKKEIKKTVWVKELDL